MLVWLKSKFNGILSKIKVYECYCCFEEKKIKYCLNTKCKYRMCDECIVRYNSEQCPSCFKKRFNKVQKELCNMPDDMVLYIDYTTDTVFTETGLLLNIRARDIVIND